MISLRSREDLLVRLGSVGLEFVSFRDLEIYRCSGINEASNSNVQKAENLVTRDKVEPSDMGKFTFLLQSR